MQPPLRRTRLWDLPIRLVHWSLVALLPAMWWTAENDNLSLHMTLGYAVLAIVAFRIIWGFVGSSNARFSQFLKGPGAVAGYLRGFFSGGPAKAHAGHNPAGGWSVIILLSLLAGQVGVGLFALNEDNVGSPLTSLVDYETARSLAEIHELGFNLILAFVVIHLAAVLYYSLIKKDRIVPPMVTGSRDLPEDVEAPRIAPLWKAAVVMVITAAFAYWIAKGMPTSLEQLTQPPPPSAEDYM
ncbi:cytochrome b/b6 domain-containing protein [Novosphingobium sp.]|uniref:cytochrome b/b6 domain-containing protein n=1 Tax=Novosphingobium sp. TaxID=1874826 RepID=UPI00286D9EE7|nr:cytochrome b/b6 domain-containing protein [Novosphingobium sp.]